MRSLAIILLLLSIPQTAYAKKKVAISGEGFFLTGNSLHESCRSNAAAPYILGMIDGLRLAEQFGAARKVCIPSGVIGGQLQDVVCRYLADNPSQRHVPATYMAMVALQGAYPCADAP